MIFTSFSVQYAAMRQKWCPPKNFCRRSNETNGVAQNRYKLCDEYNQLVANKLRSVATQFFPRGNDAAACTHKRLNVAINSMLSCSFINTHTHTQHKLHRQSYATIPCVPHKCADRFAIANTYSDRLCAEYANRVAVCVCSVLVWCIYFTQLRAHTHAASNTAAPPCGGSLCVTNKLSTHVLCYYSVVRACVVPGTQRQQCSVFILEM